MIRHLNDLIPALQTAKKWQLRPERSTVDERLAWLRSLQSVWGQINPEEFQNLVSETGVEADRVRQWDLESVPKWLEFFLKSETLPLEEGGFVPRGVVTLLQPRVYGLRLLIERLAPAILAGNSVLIKMSGRTPQASRLLARWIQEAKWPAEVAQVVEGPSSEFGDFLVSHPAIQAVSVIGRPETVEHLQKQACSLKRVFQGWTGGRSNLLLLEPWSSEEWTKFLLQSAFPGRGQSPYDCLRLFVLEKDEGDQLKALRQAMESLPSFTLPLADPNSYQKALQRMMDQEGRLLLGGGQGPALVAHLAQCSEDHQIQPPWPILLFSTVKYAFDAAKWVNNASQGFAIRIQGDLEKITKLAPRFDVGMILANQDYDPCQSLLFGTRESSVGTGDLAATGSFFSQRSIRRGFSEP